MLTHKPSNAGTDIVFIIYSVFATVYLGIQMFQGFSYLDIGFYMSGYQHFNDDPYVSYFLGQWLLSFNLTSALCRLFSINTYLGLRILHLLFIIISQTVIYFYLKRYINRHFIISGLLLATLAHFGSYTEINYNDYSVGLLTLSIMAYHYGYANNRMKAIILSGILAGVSFYFRIVNVTFIGIPFLAWLISHRYKSAIKTRNQFFGFFSGIIAACCTTTVLLYCNGMLDVFTMTLTDLFTRSSDPQDPHGVKAIIINLYDLYKGQIQGFSVIALLTFLIAFNYIKKQGRNKNDNNNRSVAPHHSEHISVGIALKHNCRNMPIRIVLSFRRTRCQSADCQSLSSVVVHTRNIPDRQQCRARFLWKGHVLSDASCGFMHNR